MVVDWTQDTTRRVIALGGHASTNGHQYIRLARWRMEEGAIEQGILEVDTSRFVFDSIGSASFANEWSIAPYGVGDDAALVLARSSGNDADPRLLMYKVDLNDFSSPSLVLDASDADWGGITSAALSDQGASVLPTSARWTWHPLESQNFLSPLGTASPGGAFFGPAAAGPHLFVSEYSPTSGTKVQSFDTRQPTQQPTDFLSYPTLDQGSACCVLTNGTRLLWYEAHNHLGDQRYEDVSLMSSPYSADPTQLVPARLRGAFKDTVYVGGGVIGANYAVHVEKRTDVTEAVYILTRLSDGAYWTVANRPGRAYRSVLYVNDDELALEEVNTEVFAQSSWAVVRVRIDSLGSPTMAD